ncbi:MAG: sigma-70 region 4 domain-containing protein [Planctomycetes bacterium]|jgi:hypothetical protein|nr:sigma-70 region 4 domain-containing protein [Planctomycetota bacterium]
MWPQDRAALVLKEAFGLSLEENADALGKSIGAIKAALHRGRNKLAVEPVAATLARPVPRTRAAFREAFRAGDLARLNAPLRGHRVLAAPSAPIAIPVKLRRGALPTTPRIELRWHHDRWLLLT